MIFSQREMSKAENQLKPSLGMTTDGIVLNMRLGFSDGLELGSELGRSDRLALGTRLGPTDRFELGLALVWPDGLEV